MLKINYIFIKINKVYYFKYFYLKYIDTEFNEFLDKNNVKYEYKDLTMILDLFNCTSLLADKIKDKISINSSNLKTEIFDSKEFLPGINEIYNANDNLFEQDLKKLQSNLSNTLKIK